MTTAAQIQLPAGYEDATPIAGSQAASTPTLVSGISLPAGYEDAQPVAGPLASSSVPGFIPDLAQRRNAEAQPGVTPAQRQASPVGQAVQGVGDAASDVWNSVTAPILHPLDTAKGVIKSVWDSLPPVQLTHAIQQALPVIDAYEKARSGGASISDALKSTDDVARQHITNINAVPDAVAAFRRNPTRTTARVLADATALATSLLLPGATEGVEGSEAAEAATATATSAEPTYGSSSWLAKYNPFTSAKSVRVGASTEPAAQAIRTGVQTAATEAGEIAPASVATTPILKGATTIFDDTLGLLERNKAAAYAQIDQEVGFDLKALKDGMANDQYNLKQLGNTEADSSQRTQLNAAINDASNRITAAETKLRAKGINPRMADDLNAKWQAGQDIRKAVVNSTDSRGSVNVDGLLNRAKNLQTTSRYGDRLTQFFGKDGAKRFVSDLQAAQDAGISAVNTQRIVRWLGGIFATGGAGAGIYKGGSAIFGGGE